MHSQNIISSYIYVTWNNIVCIQGWFIDTYTKMKKPHHPDVVYNHNKLNRKLIDILICVCYYYGGGRNYGLLLLERLYEYMKEN